MFRHKVSMFLIITLGGMREFTRDVHNVQRSSICSTCMARREPHYHVEDEKLVLNRPTASSGRIDYMGGALSVANQAMYRLFNGDK